MGAPRVVWAYDREHMGHPFIVLGARTLVDAGFHVTVMTCDEAPADAPHQVNLAFGFTAKKRFWEGINTRLNALKAREKEHRMEAVRCRKKAGYERPPGKRLVGIQWRLRSWREGFLESWVAMRRDVLKYSGIAYRDTIATSWPYVRAFWRTFWINADIFIATRPEAAVCTVLAAKLRGKRFIYYPFELYGEQAGRASALLAWLERMMLRFAVDGVITQNDKRAEVLEQERCSRVPAVIVHNYKPVRAEPHGGRLREAVPALAGKRVVLYEGYVMSGRWLDRLALALNHLPDDVAMVFLGPNKGKWVQASAAILEALTSRGRLHILPPVPHDEVLDYCADADVGVIIYDDSVRNNVFCEPGKLTDYISVGVPVTAPNFPTIGPVIERHSIGLCFDGSDPESIAATITRVLERPKSSWAPALALACKSLTWETQASVLIAAVCGEQSEERAAGAARASAAPSSARQVA